jgi:hypothetical protein
MNALCKELEETRWLCVVTMRNLLEPALVAGDGLQMGEFGGRVTFIPRLRTGGKGIKLFTTLSTSGKEISQAIETWIGGTILERKESS